MKKKRVAIQRANRSNFKIDKIEVKPRNDFVISINCQNLEFVVTFRNGINKTTYKHVHHKNLCEYGATNSRRRHARSHGQLLKDISSHQTSNEAAISCGCFNIYSQSNDRTTCKADLNLRRRLIDSDNKTERKSTRQMRKMERQHRFQTIVKINNNTSCYWWRL